MKILVDGVRWARWAVLSFVFLNMLVFGFSDLWFVCAGIIGGVMLLRDKQHWKDVLPDATVWVAFAVSWVFFVKLISALWALDSFGAISNAFNHLHFLLWPLLLPIFSRSCLTPYAAERWIALSFFCLLIFWGLVLWLWPDSEQGYRFGGGWGSPGMLANVLVFFLLWIFGALTRPYSNSKSKQRIWMALAFISGFFVLLATKARTEQLILLLGTLLILIWRLRIFFNGPSLIFLLIAVLMIFSSSFLINNDRFSEIFPEIQSYLQGGEARQSSILTSMGARMEMYRIAAEAITDRPWFGWGAGLRPSQVPQYATDPTNPMPYSNFHNLFLQIPLEIGALGAALTFFLIARLFWRTVIHKCRSADPEILLILFALWGSYALKSLVNATFGYSLPNSIFVFFSAWLWLFTSPSSFPSKRC